MNELCNVHAVGRMQFMVDQQPACLQRRATLQGRRAQFLNKKHLKNVGPIRHCEPLHCHSPGVATVARRLRIDVHNDDDDDDNNDNDNA